MPSFARGGETLRAYIDTAGIADDGKGCLFRAFRGHKAPFGPTHESPGRGGARPKHVVKAGKTSVVEGTEWRKLLDSIPTETVRDLRERALMAGTPTGVCRRPPLSTRSKPPLA